jgi:hypothetical protein
MKKTFLFALMFLSLLLISARLIKKAPKHQFLPKDMMLVQAAEPFYISSQLTTNKEYMTYLLWLSTVLQDFPETMYRALPDSNAWKGDAFNDPYLQTYLFHPSYEEYPVLGVSWLQAQEFCQWKTDRLNEYVLGKMRILSFDENQQQEHNFNTEAWLCGMYGAGYNKKIFPDARGWITFRNDPSYSKKQLISGWEGYGSLVTGDVRMPHPASPYIYSQFRLPTEEELELLPVQQAGKIYGSGFIDFFREKHWERYEPRSRDHYLPPNSGYTYSGPRAHEMRMEARRDTIFRFYVYPDTASLRYPSTVMEWCFEPYGSSMLKGPLLKKYELAEQMRGGILLNSEGEFTEKDSLGRMLNFICLKQEGGAFIPVQRYRPHTEYRKRLIRAPRGRLMGDEQFGYGNVGFRVCMSAER